MGKRKIESMKLIDSSSARNITYCKRKKGLLKKAMEISMLCGQEVFLVCLDKEKEKLILYRSSNDFDEIKVKDLINGPLSRNENFEFYTDTDYDEIE